MLFAAGREMMKLFKYIFGLALVGILGLVYYFNVALPRTAPPSTQRVNAADADLQARGTYLVENVLLCLNCHSERDWSIYGAPPMPPFGAGRQCLDDGGQTPGLNDAGSFPGTICFRNITPDKETGIGNWTDGEIMRAVREGIHRDGQTLFPIMPYFIYRNLADDDLKAVVAYLRRLDPVANAQPATQINFPVNLLIRSTPQPVTAPVQQPPDSDSIAYGKYLSTIARCEFCHTPKQGRNAEPIPGRAFAGGGRFSVGGREILSTNLTPHPSGLGSRSRDDFIATFKKHQNPETVTQSENSIMSWASYANMKDSDLGAIYDFLVTVEPVATQ